MSLTPDRLLLTPEGEQALLSAEGGGFFIRPRSFAVGDFSGTEPNTVAGTILGNTLHSGRMHYIQIVDGRTVRFTVVVPAAVGGASSLTISEAVVWLHDNTPLGRVRFSQPLVKNPGRSAMFEFMLHLSQSMSHVIDVTLSEFGSIPSVGNVDNLPAASTAIANTLAVLDLCENPDGTRTPGTATRFGAGGSVWGFSGFSRLFSGNPESVDDPGLFVLNDPVTMFDLQADEIFVLNITSGPGAGETRRYTLNTNLEFVPVDVAFSDLDTSSVVHIWKQTVGSGSGGLSLPSRDGVGEDWMLVAGPTDGSPMWTPNSNGMSRTRGNLYHPPGKLSMTAISIVPTESQRSYTLYSEDPMSAGLDESQLRLYSYRKNNNYAYVSLSGVTQFRSAFEITNNIVQFAEDIPLTVNIDTRLYELVPHDGMYTNCVSNEVLGDGVTRIFDLPGQVESVFYTKVFFGRLLVPVTAYSIDLVNRKIVFSEPPIVGVKLEINCFVQQQVAGYSTQVLTVNVRTDYEMNMIVLPVVPQSKDLVFVTEQGVHVHKSEYAVVGNKLVTSVTFAKDRNIEVMIFHNVRAEGTSDTALRGMVIDAIPTAKGLELIRQGAEPIRIPQAEITITPGVGMRVKGKFPNFILENAIAERVAQDKFDRINAQKIEKDVEEIVMVHRVDIKDDLMITVTADFEAVLGPGFVSANGTEEMQFSIAFKTVGAKSLDYGRAIIGSGEAGFATVDPSKSNVKAYSNSSRTQSIVALKENHPAGYIEVEARMRVANGTVASYGSQLRINLSGIIVPRF